jgi:uncharacterized protein (TIGR03435 family)
MAHRIVHLAAAAIAVAVPMVTLPIRAQSPQAFEVASVRPNKSTDFRGVQLQFLSGGRFVATNYPLQLLIAAAWNLPFQSPRLTGGPDWIRSERYDIEAKAENGAIPAGLPAQARKDKMRMMLRTLLADRFKLTMRRETKELPIYRLTAPVG